jgi:predicted GNAT superfamily acetyltransferase
MRAVLEFNEGSLAIANATFVPHMEEAVQPAVTIRPLSGQSDLDAAVALQQAVWGYSDLEVDSRAILTIATRFIGQVLGAFHEQRMVGLALAFAALPFGRLHSHRVGVLPVYQNLGIGRKLKLAQRDDALARNVPVIQWTFDPLQSRNAYFNLVRLGGIARTYLPNFYGITSSPLHGGLPTDRLLIEWNLESDRVRKILSGEVLPLADEARTLRLPPPGERKNPDVQAGLRTALVALFAENYALTGFREAGDEQIYVLERL